MNKTFKTVLQSVGIVFCVPLALFYTLPMTAIIVITLAEVFIPNRSIDSVTLENTTQETVYVLPVGDGYSYSQEQVVAQQLYSSYPAVPRNFFNESKLISIEPQSQYQLLYPYYEFNFKELLISTDQKEFFEIETGHNTQGCCHPLDTSVVVGSDSFSVPLRDENQKLLDQTPHRFEIVRDVALGFIPVIIFPLVIISIFNNKTGKGNNTPS